ncbi:MAG: NUDIX hydrolase [Acidimicrobiia bacterium]|nr:MAG: NUDIX hydrolase [Acidimicrobiia bacterium]
MVKPRDAARVLLIDDRERALLFRYHNPFQGHTFWVPPGGGLDAGENHRAAAVRELAEETGRDDIDIGPEIWRRDHTFRWGTRKLRQRERWFLATTPAFEVPRAVVQSLAREGVEEARWWSVDEMLHTDALLTPRRLGTLLPPILAGEIPEVPVDVGI